ncbi:RHS repeat-associated core domain-containing protein [Lewinella sp. LCG006]|uniref:RHS repeat-associated core domain-containing protein n=1 Tax=Lewinella sp. LCG006 TaxID=3231911 RepID=UPI0034607942
MDVKQRLWYYPFGMHMEGIGQTMATPAQAYRYNGKELDEATGLYDYGARYYDPAVARWGQVDPLADQYAPYSPYNYVLGNPIRLTDPDGRSVDGEYEQSADGKWVKTSTKGDEIGIDFYHYNLNKGSQLTVVTDGEYSAVMKNGRYSIQGEERTSDTEWNTLFNEFMQGTGPERSVFFGSGLMSDALQEGDSISDGASELLGSADWVSQGVTNYRGPISVALDDDHVNMETHFIGSYNYSLYKLGPRVLALVQGVSIELCLQL